MMCAKLVRLPHVWLACKRGRKGGAPVRLPLSWRVELRWAGLKTANAQTKDGKEGKGGESAPAREGCVRGLTEMG